MSEQWHFRVTISLHQTHLFPTCSCRGSTILNLCCLFHEHNKFTIAYVSSQPSPYFVREICTNPSRHFSLCPKTIRLPTNFMWHMKSAIWNLTCFQLWRRILPLMLQCYLEVRNSGQLQGPNPRVQGPHSNSSSQWIEVLDSPGALHWYPYHCKTANMQCKRAILLL